MCGRYFLSNPGDIVARTFGLDEGLELSPRYNISPGQEAPVVLDSEAGRDATAMHWGYAPAKSGGRFLINARSETVAEKDAFRESFALRRCLVPASGFFEWRKNGQLRAPYVLRRKDGTPFAMAGLWRRSNNSRSAKPPSYVVLTTAANAIVAKVHDRMPVILDPADFDNWLDPRCRNLEQLTRLLRPLPAELMTSYPVSSFVNSAANEGERCIEEVEEAPRQQRLF